MTLMRDSCVTWCQVSVGGAKRVIQHSCVVWWHSLLSECRSASKTVSLTVAMETGRL